MLKSLFSVANVGILLSLLGSLALARGLLISRAEAIRLGSSYWSGGTDEDRLKLPPVADRVRQSNYAIAGIILLLLGSCLQIVGARTPSRAPLTGRWAILAADSYDHIHLDRAAVDRLLRTSVVGIATIDEVGRFAWTRTLSNGRTINCPGEVGLIGSAAVVTACFVGHYEIRDDILAPLDTTTPFILVRAR
jgi:hypothetical protein